MFNFGWGELVVIGIVALIAIGPKELPTVLRTLGQAMGKIRRMANEFQGQFQEALREVEIADLKKQADEMVNSVNESVTGLADFDPMADTQKQLEKDLHEIEHGTPSAAAADFSTALPAPEEQTALPAPAEPLPAIDVPLPEEPPAVGHEDFAQSERPETKPAGGEGAKA
jgi:sec-independent protein translocase protein TatB